MSTLKINIPEGFKIDKFDEKTGEVSFIAIPKDIKERITCFDDVLKENGIKKEDFEKQCQGLFPDEIAYRKAKLVCLAYNEGWIPNWDNSSEYKYYPWFDMRSSASGGFSCDGYDDWATLSAVGSRLCFKSSDLAKTAGKLFEQEIYKPLFTL